MTTNQDIAQRALAQLATPLPVGARWSEHTLRILVEAVAAGRREGERDGFSDGFAAVNRSADQVRGLIDKMLLMPLTRREP
jgi:hypothetical protein